MGKASKGIPRNTAAIPAAFPICEARWSADIEHRGKAESVR